MNGDRPYIAAHEDSTRDAVTITMGRERVSIRGEALRQAAYDGSMENVLASVYDAAKRDVHASMSPLERPQPRVIRTGNRSELAYPRYPGCVSARRHGR